MRNSRRVGQPTANQAGGSNLNAESVFQPLSGSARIRSYFRATNSANAKRPTLARASTPGICFGLYFEYRQKRKSSGTPEWLGQFPTERPRDEEGGDSNCLLWNARFELPVLQKVQCLLACGLVLEHCLVADAQQDMSFRPR